MIPFLRRASLGISAQREDPRWQRVQLYQEKLQLWGFGGERSEEGYRDRLKNLCEFLRALEPDGPYWDVSKNDLEQFLHIFEKANLRLSGEFYIRRLEDLQAALKALVKRDQECAQPYLARLRKWSPFRSLQSPPADRGHFEKALKFLGLLPDDVANELESPLLCLSSLGNLLGKLEAERVDERRVGDEKNRWKECFEDYTLDLKWAYLQVLVRLAQQCLKEKSSRLNDESLRKGVERLEELILGLESEKFFQARSQGLYGLLAEIYLAHVQAPHPDSESKEKLEFISKALTYAQHAVEKEPKSVRERLRLLKIFSSLGDYGEMKAEADIALNLDSGSETLKIVGASFWDRVAALHDRRDRRKILREASQFFENALKNVESDPLNKNSPFEQVEAHGWAHFWLGRFRCESGRCDEGAIHLKTARTLGFKPLESRVELAWAYLLVRDHKQAAHAFKDAIAEAGRQRKSNHPVAQGPGEERKIVDLEFDAWLGWALLWAERDLFQAEEKISKAESLLPSVGRPNEKDLQAAIHEVRGLAYRKGEKVPDAVKELEAAIRLSPRSGAYFALASVRLEEARTTTEDGLKGAALERALQAYRLGRENDVRGRHRFEVRDLRRKFRHFEQQAKTAAPPTPNS